MTKLTLKACRVNVNASAGEMAKAVGVSEDTIYNWEKGKYAPTYKNMLKIIEFFESKNFSITINDINFLP
jgi:DNA-binding XRE family transcriptional regulator